MSIHNLDRIFKPNSVAIIGASEREGSIHLPEWWVIPGRAKGLVLL